MDRVTTGLKHLDSLICGGFPDRTVVLFSGSSGAGKTLFGLNFLLDGASRGEKCCYISFSESEEELLRASDGIESLKHVRKCINKTFYIKHIDLEKHTLAKFMQTLKQYPQIDRLVIDNVNKLLLFTETERKYRMMMIELMSFLKEKSRCSLLLCETKDNEIDTGKGESFECDGVINLSFLELEENPIRTLEIHKLRYTSFNPKVAYNLKINNHGLELVNKII